MIRISGRYLLLTEVYLRRGVGNASGYGASLWASAIQKRHLSPAKGSYWSVLDKKNPQTKGIS